MESKLPSGMTALLIEALGGKEKAEVALRQVIRTKCRDAIGKPGATIGDVYDLAVQEGWLAEFLSLTIADLTAPLVVAMHRGGKSCVGLTDAILAHLESHPGAKMREISEATRGRPGSIKSLIFEARKRGKIVACGLRGAMTYYLPTDFPKLA